MFKMKSLFSIVAIFSFVLVSCTERIPEKERPNVDERPITMIKATVSPLQLAGAAGVAHYSWKEEQTIGIYGMSRVNDLYLPVSSTVGSNEAYFYGNEVAGDLLIYMPYSNEGIEAARSGRVIVPALQQYYADPFDHLMYNATFFAPSTTENVTFDFYTGLVKVELKYDIENITSVGVSVANSSTEYSRNFAGYLAIDDDVENLLTKGVDNIVIEGFPEGTNSSIDNPLVLWVAVAPGEYENFVIEISNSEMTIASPVKGPFVVEKKAICEKTCTAVKIDHDNGIGDFEGENGQFNPKK